MSAAHFIGATVYVVVAIIASCLYGCFAVEIFQATPPAHLGGKGPRSWRIHQWWLNFAGSAVGWLCLWFVGVQVYTGGWFDWGYATLALVAFIGVTGYMPMAVVGLVVGLAKGVGAMLGKVSGLG
jgi:hypothetical protein